MNLFRSEEHASRWVAGREPGETVPVATLVELARVWYGDRLAPDWKPRTREQSQELFERVGLSGGFWRLP